MKDLLDLELSATEILAEHTGNREWLALEQVAAENRAANIGGRWATLAEREGRVIGCRFDRVECVIGPVAADPGALNDGEEGFVGYCRCGFRTRIRYAPIAARAAVAEHVLATR